MKIILFMAKAFPRDFNNIFIKQKYFKLHKSFLIYKIEILLLLYKIALIFQGEYVYADLCGQFSNEDYPEMNYRERLEHHGRSFEWNFFLGIEGSESKDLS